MNQKEKEVLEIIRNNPFIYQKDIANILNLPRSTVASIISSLTEKKIIKGKAYVLNTYDSGIYCIGAMNVDRKYTLHDKLIKNTSNPVSQESCIGGVARNIGENLGRLGHNIYIISLAGYDKDYDFIKSKSSPYINFQYVDQTQKYHTGSYNAILNKDGEMEFAFADMNIYDEMNLTWIKKYEEILKEAKLIVCDLNLPKESIAHLIKLSKRYEIDFILVPVSGPKMKRIPKDLYGVTWLIVNKDESETFFNTKANNDQDFYKLADKWISCGVKNLVITRGENTLIYANDQGLRKIYSPVKTNKIIDVTGAGDSFTAAVVHGHLLGYTYEKILKLAITNSYYTIQSKETVRINLSKENLENELNQLEKEGKIQ